MNRSFSPFVAVLSTAVLTTSSSFADTLQVPDVYPTIQAALDAATDGDTVLVADGTYTGEGNRDMDFGGKAITVRSENGPLACTIDIDARDADRHRAFHFRSGETAASMLRGFTIRNGFMNRGGAVLCEDSSPLFVSCIFEGNTAWTDSSGDGGGAVHIVHGRPTFDSCRFLQNHAEINFAGRGGGAVQLRSLCESDGGCGRATFNGCLFGGNTATGPESSRGGAVSSGGFVSAEFVNCRFEGNRADAGGAGALGGTATLDRCAFHDNVASSAGGGALSLTGGRPAFRAYVVGCEFVGNVAQASNGGAVSAGRGDTTIINSIFLGNQAGGGGGGLSLANQLFHADIANSIFWGNEASSGGALRFSGTGTAAAANSILWGNSPLQIDQVDEGLTVTYSDVQGGWPGIGNLAVDPLFVDPDNGDFRLSRGSPCIDAGDNDAVPGKITEDLDGRPRIQNDCATPDTGNGQPPVVDMGAYEAPSQDLDGSGAVDFGDILAILAAWGNAGGPEDLDGNGAVNFGDLLIVITQWGPCE